MTSRNSRQDLTGQVFGRLTVVRREESGARWICLCSCGNESKPIQAADLTRGKVTSCGCYQRERASARFKKDLSGQRFGMLTAVECIGLSSRKLYVWRCTCDCGGSKNAVGADLTSGRTTSCGCMRSVSRRRRVEDLTGRVFGNWRVVAQAPLGPNGQSFYYCDCSCGNRRAHRVAAHNLNNGTSRSCGCIQAEKASERNLMDLTGHRFGRLIVLSRGPNTAHDRVQWNCRCDCGKSVLVRSHSLTMGETTSCGCFANELTSERTVARLQRMEGVRRIWVYENKTTRILMRSSWEVVFARWLDSHGEPWLYEPRVFMLAKATRYVPDFFLPQRDVWVEVKGFVSKHSEHKIKVFRQTHPLVLVGKRFILRITYATNLQQVSSMVPRLKS